MAASNSSEAVDVLPFPNGTLVDVAAADLECGSIELVQNSTSLNAMKFYGQVIVNCTELKIQISCRLTLDPVV